MFCNFLVLPFQGFSINIIEFYEIGGMSSFMYYVEIVSQDSLKTKARTIREHENQVCA
jgi:hypothetical protein